MRNCPFCGGEAELRTRKGANGLTQYRYRCSECHAAIGRWHGGISGHTWTALETWNRRVGEVFAEIKVPKETQEHIEQMVREMIDERIVHCKDCAKSEKSIVYSKWFCHRFSTCDGAGFPVEPDGFCDKSELKVAD